MITWHVDIGSFFKCMWSFVSRWWMGDTSNSGACWHIYHDCLLDWCYDVRGRREYIKKYKPASEQPLRLRLMKRVKGELPPELVEALNAYVEVWNAWDKTQSAQNEAWLVWQKAIASHQDYIDALHEQECPNCPWDGHTIFSQKGGA